MKNWNIVLNKFVEIKNKYIEQFGLDTLWNYDVEKQTCLEYWVESLHIDEYCQIISLLQMNEYNDMLLVRYGQYSDVFGAESEVEYADFWHMFDGFYMECRSMVLNIKKDELVLTPFRKFRNINECEENSEENIANRIRNAKCIEITNKLDGSMQSARWYNDSVVMAGSQALNPAKSFRLYDGYEMINADGYIQLLKDYSDYTAIFEFISLKDAHVVRYNKDQEGLYLIGMRNVNTGEEMSYAEVIGLANQYNILTTEAFDKTLAEIMQSLDEKKSDEAEGFVLNIDGYKVKIKYNDYVNMHGILSALSSINLVIRSIADDNWDDFIAKVPKAYHENVLETANTIFKFMRLKDQEVQNAFNEVQSHNFENRKLAMIWMDDNLNKSVLGYVRNLYLGKENNYLKNRAGRYIIMREILEYLN